jgi:hypothetical protein
VESARQDEALREGIMRKPKIRVGQPEWSNNSDDCEGGGTVHEDRALPENRTLHPKADRNSRFQTLHIAELATFRRLTLPEIPPSLLLMCPTYSLLDIRRSDSVLCRLAIVEF